MQSNTSKITFCFLARTMGATKQEKGGKRQYLN